ncbi:MAG: hypothetical protein ACOYB3_01975 [Azonexus sp.]
MTTLAPHTFTVRTSRPECDIHKYVLHSQQILPTIVDAKTMGRGSWANMCLTCWDTHGTGTLGLGAGQMIYAPLTAAEEDLHLANLDGNCWGCGVKPVGRMVEHAVWCAYLNSASLSDES